MMKFLYLFFIFFTNLYAQDYSGKEVMNGHQMKDFKDFEKKWKLVTVRFRKDTAEMRFTYANDLAYKSLLKGVIDYPDGAVFAKIGLKTEEDTSFPSSAVPKGPDAINLWFAIKKNMLILKDGVMLFLMKGV